MAQAQPAPPSAPVSADDEQFFEAEVRPLLAEHCQSCHGAEVQESGLRLDSSAAVLRGGDAGPVILAKRPEESPMVHAIQYGGKVQMPPDGKLDDRQIAVLIDWIARGAFWPEGDPAAAAEPAAPHWAYQPLRAIEPPACPDPAWNQTEIDRFIHALQRDAGLSPSPPADGATLLRRATFDLVGLPPSAEEMAAFLSDPSPDAYGRAIDRLLASPRYGERWARHWLDVARYADTKGYVLTEERRYPYSYTFRDYCIQAFNEDRPYDRFILEQLAADQLPLGEDKSALAGMGFLTIGRRFSNNVHDIIDDRIDVVSRGLLGLTVSCARCHDHKFDAIPTADYYSLFGVFSSSTEPRDPPVIGQPVDVTAFQQFELDLAERQQALDAFLGEKIKEFEQELRVRVADYLVQVVRTNGGAGAAEGGMSFAAGEVRPRIVTRWRNFVKERGAACDPVFVAWAELAALPPESFAAEAPRVLERMSALPCEGPGERVNRLVKEALAANQPANMEDVARTFGDVLSKVSRQWEEQRAATPDAAALPDPAAEELRRVLYGDKAPVNVPRDEARRYLDRAAKNKLGELANAVEQLKVNSPGAPPRAMSLIDSQTPGDAQILVRGNPGRPGDFVPRQFLAVLAGDRRQPFKQGSGRLELAQAIASPDNPLTARVLVNRVWMHHFGTGLVRTPGDFGVRGEAPSHPELLDWLADRFIRDGWSIKRLHRRIVASQAYRQSSAERPDAEVIDPENRLLTRMNRRRLEFEALRDSLLAASGKLDRTMFGKSVDIVAEPLAARRTVYAFIDRQDLPGLFRVFDFASPDTSTPQRSRTTVPQQALFAMNSPFVQDQASALAAQAERAAAGSVPERIQFLYGAALSRAPTQEELAWGQEWLAESQAAGAGTAALETYAQVLLLTNEFAFID